MNARSAARRAEGRVRSGLRSFERLDREGKAGLVVERGSIAYKPGVILLAQKSVGFRNRMPLSPKLSPTALGGELF